MSSSQSQPQQSYNPHSSATADMRGYSDADNKSFEELKSDSVQGEKHFFKIESLERDYDDKEWKEDPNKPTMYGHPDKGGVGGTGWNRYWQEGVMEECFTDRCLQIDTFCCLICTSTHASFL